MREIRWRWIDGSKLLAVTLALFAIVVAARLELHLNPIFPSGFKLQRAEVLTYLEETPGDHLVFVRYLDGHLVHNDWVFNRADIDASRIVWARDMGRDRNAELVSYFSDRRPWLLESGRPEGVRLPYKQEVLKLESYPETPSSTPPTDEGRGS